MSLFGNSKSEMSLEEFEVFFKENFKPVRNFIYYKTSDAVLAEDIAQDAFFKLWENRHHIDRHTLRAYIYTIANNLTLNALKKNQLHFKFINLQTERHDRKSPQYLMEMEEFDQKLQEALGALPDGVREVFLMNRIDGLKYTEIAQRLKLSVKSIEKRMSKALNILRSKIDRKI